MPHSGCKIEASRLEVKMSAEPTSRLLKTVACTIAEAVRVLTAGGLVAFPTETVYSLGADATNATSIARLYAAKGRPSFNPLIAHVADIAEAHALAVFTGNAEKVAAAYWPGPLTMVLRRQQK